jgi:hypothetical protein
MLSFKELSEKKTKVKINPKLKDMMEGGCGTLPKMSKGGAITVDKIKNNHGDDCDCKKCDKKRRSEDLGDETTVSTEETAYVSQEEVSEESTEKIAETETSFLTFGKFTEGKSLSIDDQMKISRDAAKGRNPKPDHKAIRGKMLKKPLPKDTRTDAQKMTDATGPRPGSRYRGD